MDGSFAPPVSYSNPLLMMNPIETIWQMGAASLFSNNNKMLIPFNIAEIIGENGIDELKSRFSALFGGASTAAYEDHHSKVICIYLLADSPASSTVEFDFASPPESTPSPFTTSAEVTSAVGSLRSPGKKAKVPRPPNSFILYRQEYHPKLKAANPALHNNDISVILGKQWAQEPESVKAKYRARADAIKKQHALENPGYQYAPRRASEKKRRMTARKLTQLEPATNDVETPGSGHNVIDLTDSHESNVQTSMTAIEELGLQRPSMNGTLSGPHGTTGMSALMPMDQLDFSSFEQQLEAHLAPLQSHGSLPFNTLNREAMTATAEPHAVNEQEFMNTLVDWDGINEDARLVQEIIQEEQEALAADIGGPDLVNLEEAAAKFDAELERLSELI